MKVMLVEPSVQYKVTSTAVGVVAGLPSIASYCLSKGLNAELTIISNQVDCAIGKKDQVFQEISKERPDVVGITSLTSSYYEATSIAKFAKKEGAMVILGGLFPTFNYASVLQNKEIDAVVIGEGEETFFQVLHALENGSPFLSLHGIAFRKGLDTRKNPETQLLDLSKLPLPAYDLAPLSKYYELNSPLVYETSRGCPFRCEFCTLSQLFPKCRRKSVDQVVNELRIISQSYKFKKIKITDDTFTLSKSRAMKLCHRLAKEDLNFEFIVETRIDLLNEKVLDIMFAAGVREILSGIEHVETKILETMNKGINIRGTGYKDHVIKTIRYASKLGFVFHPIFMIGWPGETKKTLHRLQEAVVTLTEGSENVRPYLSFVTPHPGSKLGIEAEELGLKIIENDLSKYTHLFPVAIPNSLGPNALELMVRTYNNISCRTKTKEYNPLLSVTDNVPVYRSNSH